ncbi:MAG TPA: tRNA guanosine(34) transglycosylase Tgt, partial [Chthoniobacterales bacterium]|nr:tRNA guanosine(34) transglycosylase Tgt [Chthoniobacterales bacterium]
SLEMTTRWAGRCKAVAAGLRPARAEDRLDFSGDDAAHRAAATARQLVFGIVQGATFADLRRASAEATVQIGFDGYAIGGVSVGESEEEMMRAVESSEPFLPADKPRYAMGLGTPPQMLELIARGIDMFDCVLPTRLARNGTAFTSNGTLNLKNAEFALDKNPIEDGCGCPACREFTRGYIRHLVKAEEILGLRLITLHNLHFYLNLMRRTRAAIDGGTFAEFRREFAGGYKPRHETSRD